MNTNQKKLTEIGAMELVKHAIDSTDTAPKGMSWIDYWESKTKCNTPSMCPCCGKHFTDKNPIVGAYVVKIAEINIVGRKLYITPTCKKCNDTYKGKNAYKAFIVPLLHLCEIGDQDIKPSLKYPNR